jgi:ribosome biogenesis GTPase
MEGIVVKSTGSWYSVRTPDEIIHNCVMRGLFRLKGGDSTNLIAVGDHVTITPGETGNAGLITSILPRTNYLVRKSKNLSKQSHVIAANLDRLFLVASLILPKTSMGFIDRILVGAEAFRIPAAILFNKADIYDDKSLAYFEALKNIYEPLGYPCFLVSALKAEDIQKIKSLMKDKVQVFTGHSGVGKSSLINALQSGLDLKTAPISKQHFKGKHTTTFAEMHAIDGGGDIIDTPGIKEFGMYDYSKEEIGHYFPEMRPLLHQCHFNNCLHYEERQCAVKEAVKTGNIHEWRYYNYLSILLNEDNYIHS